MIDVPPELTRERRGREAFAHLLKAWMSRSGWSYKVMADLAYHAVLTLEASGVPQQGPKQSYAKGELAIVDGHVWRAQRDGALAINATLRGHGGEWEHLTAIRRTFPSQINNLVLNTTDKVSAQLLDTLGLLNRYIYELQRGRVPGPADENLRKRALGGVVIEDEDGIFGPEEFLSVYLERMPVPQILQAMTDQDAHELSARVARQIREGFQECGLDLVDDWPQFISAYPTSDAARHAKIRDVAQGRTSWSAERVLDEEAAVRIALNRLRARHRASPTVVQG